MTKKAKDNPADRLPDWRATLPLAQAAPRCGARNRAGNPAGHPPCQMGDARCTGARAPDRGRRRGWNECDGRRRSMVCIRPRRFGLSGRSELCSVM